MCNGFKKRKEDKKNTDKRAKACWKMFHQNNTRRTKKTVHRTKREDSHKLTPSIKADLPSTSLKSIEMDQERSLSQSRSTSAIYDYDKSRTKRTKGKSNRNQVENSIGSTNSTTTQAKKKGSTRTADKPNQTWLDKLFNLFSRK